MTTLTVWSLLFPFNLDVYYILHPPTTYKCRFVVASSTENLENKTLPRIRV